MNQCTGCGLCFLFPAPSLDATQKMYEDGYTASAEANLKTKRLADDYFKKIHPYLDRSGPFLEVGGSHGWLSELVKKATGRPVTMLEPGRTAAAAASQRGLETFCGFLHDFKPQKPYDDVFAAHVIEHVCDLDGFLQECAAALGERGRLMLLTPNGNAWKFKCLKSRWPWAATGEHSFLLTEKAAELLLARNGFKVITIKGTQPARAYYPFMVTGRLSAMYSRLFGKAERGKSAKSEIPALKSPSTSSQRQGVIDSVKKAGRIILWIEYITLSTLDFLIGRKQADELLIVAEKSGESR